jgi:ribosome production factor 2
VFAARDVSGVALTGLDHALVATAVPAPASASSTSAAAATATATAAGPARALLRVYTVHLKRSAGRVPRVELAPMGPSLDLSIRRVTPPAPDLERAATRVPKQCVGFRPRALDLTLNAFAACRVLGHKTKNVSTDSFGETHGQIHMERQDFSKLQLHKRKGFKMHPHGAKEAAAAADDAPATTDAAATAVSTTEPAPAAPISRKRGRDE